GASSSIPKSIIDLMREKEITAFVDGDRGGDMIINTLLHYGDIDFVAKAPDGKEVEELTRKEIIKSLRSRMPIDQYLNSGKKIATPQPEQRQQPQQQQQQAQPHEQQFQRQQPKPQQQYQTVEPLDEEKTEDLLPTIESRNASEIAEKPQPQKPALESIILGELAKGLDELSNRLRCRLYDSSGSVIKEGPIRDIFAMIGSTDNIYGIVLDGTITQRLVAAAEEKGVKAIYGLRVNQMPRRPPGMIIYAKEGESLA
ncbi:MAG: hypothetical protein QXL63_03450, partial [Candidatus Micrarchaeaceae archaeon]